MQAAVGFSTHSGWAVAVTAGVGDDGHLAVVDRRRVTLIGDDLPRMAYHTAAELDADAAEQLVASVEASIADHARAVVGELVSAPDVAVKGIAVVGQPREIPGVAVVLASHAPRCTRARASGTRRGIVEAANDLGLPVLRIGPDELTARTTELLQWTPDRTGQELAAVRTALGAPWQTDHKQAALAALTLLRSQPGR